MSSEDPTPREGRPMPPSTSGAADPDAAPDPLWAPTSAQRSDSAPTSMPIGTPAPRVEPARAPYGQAAPSPAANPPTSPTVAMRSTDVPRVGYSPGGPYQPPGQVVYD